MAARIELVEPAVEPAAAAAAAAQAVMQHGIQGSVGPVSAGPRL